MKENSSRWALPAIVVVAVVAAWAVMPGVDTGPDLDAVSQADPAAGAAAQPAEAEEPAARGGEDAVVRTPEAAPSDDGWGAANGGGGMQAAGARPQVRIGGDPADDKAAQLIARRAERIASRLEGTTEKLAGTYGWSSSQVSEVTAITQRAARELDALRVQLDNGELDIAEASPKITEIQEAAMREVEAVVDEKSSTDMRNQLGLVSEEEAWEAWEGIPFEEWAAQQEAGGGGW